MKWPPGKRLWLALAVLIAASLVWNISFRRVDVSKIEVMGSIPKHGVERIAEVATNTREWSPGVWWRSIKTLGFQEAWGRYRDHRHEKLERMVVVENRTVRVDFAIRKPGEPVRWNTNTLMKGSGGFWDSLKVQTNSASPQL